MRNGIQVRAIGRLDRLPPPTQESIRSAIERTADNREMTLVFALSYGGRSEIVDAARKPAAGRRAGRDRSRVPRREDLRLVPLRARRAGPGPADPHRSGVAHLQLPPLATRLRGDLHHGSDVAGLPQARPRERHCRVSEARAALRASPASRSGFRPQEPVGTPGETALHPRLHGQCRRTNTGRRRGVSPNASGLRRSLPARGSRSSRSR